LQFSNAFICIKLYACLTCTLHMHATRGRKRKNPFTRQLFQFLSTG
jgi:hypothetical protein